MNLYAIRHIPMSADAFAVSENQAVFRLRAARGNLTRCTLYVGDRSCRKTPVDFYPVDMAVTAGDALFEWFEARPVLPFNRICYYFQLEREKETCLYYANQFTQELTPDRSEYFQLPILHRADIPAVPDWAYDAIVYHIFPDSFATKRHWISKEPTHVTHNGIHYEGLRGGTLQGILENLDYIQEMGCNTIYLNPIFMAGEYHKYDLMDYFHIDPCFGTDQDFTALVNEIHKRDMRIIIDGVFNHCGWRFFAFEDVVRKGKESPYWEWFYRLEEPVIRPEDEASYPNYACFGYERKMPKLMLDYPEARDYFISVGVHWVKEYDIDGWRLDVANEVNDGFWRGFRQAVKAVKPDCLLIGEIWESAPHWLDGTLFDSTMNYDFRRHARDFFAKRTIGAETFDGRITEMRMRYRDPYPYLQLNLLDSHDASRFLSLCGSDTQRMRLAVLFQMTAIGMPCVFYGDEQGITGVQEAEYRAPMPWAGEACSLSEFYRDAIRLRRQYPALRRGDWKTLVCRDGLYAFRRTYQGDTIDIWLSNSQELQTAGIEGLIILEDGYENGRLAPFGYAVAQLHDTREVQNTAI